MTILPRHKEEMRHLEEAARQVQQAADAAKVNKLVDKLRTAFDGHTNADVYCAMSHLLAMLASSEGHGYTIPIVTLLAMQSHQRYEERTARRGPLH